MDTLILVGSITLFVLIVAAIIGVIFSRLYVRASKQLAFVRTGFGGEKVVANGGALVFPVIHGIVWVKMETLKLEVRRAEKTALTTKDRMRADVTAEFFMRVRPSAQFISTAAQTLGERTLDESSLRQLMEGKFVDALRAVAVSMDLEELQNKRSEFAAAVQKVVSSDLERNGLELETVSLTSLDQTDPSHYRADNIFDAEGLTKITRTVEGRRKERNEIEQTTSVTIAEQNRTAENRKLEINREIRSATLQTEQQIAEETAMQQAAVQKAEATSTRDVEKNQIETRQEVELARQDSQIKIAKKTEEMSLAEATANTARAQTIASEEAIETARATEIANREKAVRLIAAEEEAQRLSIGVVVASEAEKSASINQADAAKILAAGEADAIKIRAEAQAESYKVEADGKRAINEAANVLSAEQVAMAIRLAIVEATPRIIEAAVKPMERIDGIKILHVDGLGGAYGNGSASVAGGATGGLGDELANAALRFRGQSALVDSVLNEIGLNGATLGGLTGSIFTPPPAAPVVQASTGSDKTSG